LPKLKDSTVLLDCIREGLRSKDFFGYASEIDKEGKYLGLEFGNPGAGVVIDSMSVLIKKEVALKQQLTEQEKEKSETGAKISDGKAEYTATKTNDEILAESKKKEFKRFYGRVDLDSTRLPRDAGQIAEEVIQHLTALPSSDVKISLEISANVPSGIPEKNVRIIIENCKTLKFKLNDFEE